MNKPRVDLGPEPDMPERLVALAARLGITEALCLGKDAHGRPTARWGDHSLAYSRSHARGLCAQALALSGRVGIDLVDPAALPVDGIHELWSESERRWIPPGEARLQAQLWAAKEATLKALGLGLGFGSEFVELEWDGNRAPRLSRIAGLPAEGWHLEYASHAGLVLALAWVN